MPDIPKAHAVAAISDPQQEALVRTALLAAGLAVRLLPREPGPLERLFDLAPQGRRCLYVLDPSRLADFGVRLDVVGRLISRRSENHWIALHSDRIRPQPPSASWAAKHGAVASIGRLSAQHLDSSARPLIDAAKTALGLDTNGLRLRDYAAVLLTTAQTQPDIEHHATLAAMADAGIDADALAVELADHGPVSRDRSWRLRTYCDCFVGADAVRWLRNRLGVTGTRAAAIGEALRARGHFHHVVGEQPFRDGEFFYRFHRQTDRVAMLDLDAVEQALRGLTGVEVADRRWRGMNFPRCFVGSEALHWLQSRFALSHTEAVTIGQSLLETHAFRHVADEHDFFGTDLYYRFLADRLALAS